MIGADQATAAKNRYVQAARLRSWATAIGDDKADGVVVALVAWLEGGLTRAEQGELALILQAGADRLDPRKKAK
jgi:hypothetical protein